jgi:hypothetical protein
MCQNANPVTLCILIDAARDRRAGRKYALNSDFAVAINSQQNKLAYTQGTFISSGRCKRRYSGLRL